MVKRDPYKKPISLGILDWEWYGNSMGQGYFYWGVPENPTDSVGGSKYLRMKNTLVLYSKRYH